MPRNARAHMVPAPSGLDAKTEPGACYFIYHADEHAHAGPCGVIHACPCGCGARSALWFRGRGRGRQEWDVTGEWPDVTLTPSIGIRFGADGVVVKAGYHWHGYLRNGVFEEL